MIRDDDELAAALADARDEIADGCPVCATCCTGTKRKAYCRGAGSWDGPCGGLDCSACRGEGVDHGDCECSCSDT